MKQEKTAYETSDIYFGAYINALGNILKGTAKCTERGKEKTIFIFELTDEEWDGLKNNFFGGDGEVKALAYMHCLRSLKSLCFV